MAGIRLRILTLPEENLIFLFEPEPVLPVIRYFSGYNAGGIFEVRGPRSGVRDYLDRTYGWRRINGDVRIEFLIEKAVLGRLPIVQQGVGIRVFDDLANGAEAVVQVRGVLASVLQYAFMHCDNNVAVGDEYIP